MSVETKELEADEVLEGQGEDACLQLRENLMAAKAARIAVSPQHALRASSIHPCDRHLFYQVTAWQDRAPVTPETQCLFDFGGVVEEAALSDLRLAGYAVERQQSAFEIKVSGGVVTGHIDGMIRGPGMPERGVPLEIKGYTFAGDRLTHWRDFLRAPQHWLQQVPCQMQLYLLAHNAEWGVLAIFDKKTAQINPLAVELDLDFAEGILRRAESTYAAKATGEAPERCAWGLGLCEKCDFAHLCGPHAPVPVEGYVADPALEDAARVYLETSEAVRAHGQAEKLLKGYAKGLEAYEQFLVGPAQVSIKHLVRHYKDQPAKAAYDLDCTTVKITPASGPVADEEEEISE